MIIDLTDAFGIPVGATNITYGNGDCDGNNITAPFINPSTGVVNFDGYPPGGSYWYHVTFDLPGDNPLCSPANCTDLEVTPQDALNIQFDESSDAFVDNYFHICAFAGAYSLDDDVTPEIRAVFRDPDDTIDVPSTFNGDYSMTFTEWGSIVIQTLCTGSFIIGQDDIICTMDQTQMGHMTNLLGLDNSDNQPDSIVSGIELTISLDVDNVYNEAQCADPDVVRFLFMPIVGSVDVADLDCATIDPDFGSAFSFDLFKYLLKAGVGGGDNVNGPPNVYPGGAYGESGDLIWSLDGVPACLMSQLNFTEPELEQVSSDSFNILITPGPTSSIRTLNLTLCASDVPISFLKTFTFSTGYICSDLDVFNFTSSDCPSELTCYEVDISATVNTVTVDYGLGPINIITQPQFDCDAYGEPDEANECHRAQLVQDINEWFDANGFIGTATLVRGVMDSVLLRIVGTNIEFISVTLETGPVVAFSDVGEGCLVCEPTEEFFFDEHSLTIAAGTTTNLYTLLLTRYPDAPNNGTFVIDVPGGAVDTCGTIASTYNDGPPTVINGGINHGLFDSTDATGAVTVGYEFEHPSTGCTMCIAFYVTIIPV